MLKITYDRLPLLSSFEFNYSYKPYVGKNAIIHGPLYNYTRGAEIFQYVSQKDTRDLEKLKMGD